MILIFAAACGATNHDAQPDAGIGSNIPCSATGLLHDQALTVGDLDRHYMLYVPSSYVCGGSAVPLVVDFNGTWTGSDADAGEEFYALPGAIAAAESDGFILARPRSLSSVEDGVSTYRWDENPGDYVKNEAFGHALVTELEGLYAIDPARVYALGFSSGTGMAAQFFADNPQTFHGYAFVGGGYFPGEAPTAFHVDPAVHMYGVSGYRDYLYPDEETLLGLLDTKGFARAQYFQRTDDNGHELYGWHYLEMFDWLDRDNRPAAGSLGSAWTAETVPATEDLTALARDGSGGLVATGGSGGIFHRDASTGWSRVAAVDGAPGLAGACILPSGQGIAVGDSAVAHTTDHGQTWLTDVSIPQFVPGYFEVPFLNAIGCSTSQLVTFGYWNAANSSNATDWTQTMATEDAGYAAQGAQVKVSAAGTWIAAGYYYLGRSTDGVTFTAVDSSVPDIQWLMGIASIPGGHWFAVGEAGTLITSNDDGKTWLALASGTTEDLYAIAFASDGLHGLAVGAHGAAIATSNGGATWTLRATGLDAFVGDVTWLDSSTALVVGGNGLAATTQLP